MSTTSYYDLEVGKEFLASMRELAPDGEPGIHASDVSAAELQAKIEIDSLLAMVYDVSNWGASTPLIIATIANYLGSAALWAMRYTADGMDPNGGPMQGLRESAMSLIDDLVEDRRVIVNADGSVQAAKVKSGLTGPAS